MPHALWPGVGGPPPAARPGTATTPGRPLPTRVGLQVERAELIDADDHLRVAGLHVAGAVHQPVQVQHTILLGLRVRVA